jgi:hypothetical protein
MSTRAIRRLTVLKNEADATPVPSRRFFHVGRIDDLEDVGLCIPMIAFVADNLSRFVLSDTPSSLWGSAGDALLVTLPNLAVEKGEGVCIGLGKGNDESLEHPAGKGKMHFVYLGLDAAATAARLKKIYLYRLEGVQVQDVTPKAVEPG